MSQSPQEMPSSSPEAEGAATRQWHYALFKHHLHGCDKCANEHEEMCAFGAQLLRTALTSK